MAGGAVAKHCSKSTNTPLTVERTSLVLLVTSTTPFKGKTRFQIPCRDANPSAERCTELPTYSALYMGVACSTGVLISP